MKVKNLIHPLEQSVEKCIVGFQVEFKKLEFETGTTYDFKFGDVDATVSLPTYGLRKYSNIVRVEIVIGTMDAQSAGRALVMICADLDLHCNHAPIRAVLRDVGPDKMQIVLQFVAEVEDIQESMFASVLINGLDFACSYKNMWSLERDEGVA